MSTPGNYPLTIYRGDSYRWQFKLWTDVGKTVAADLTGVVAKAEIRDKPSGTVKAPFTCSVTLPNIVNMELSATDSAKLTASRQLWDLQLTYLSGDVATVLAGAVAVTLDVTV